MEIQSQVAAVKPASQTIEDLRNLAIKLEATFLAEMLKSSGLEDNNSNFSGQIGETQFASFLTMERAELMAKNGGIGLAQQIFEALSASQRNISDE